MFEQILSRMREKIRTRQYVMTVHAEEEKNDDGLTIFDIENCMLTGQIIERQKDVNTAEWKHLVLGQSVVGDNAMVVAKISLTDKLVIITVYRS